jgi:hypothetical protein
MFLRKSVSCAENADWFAKISFPFFVTNHRIFFSSKIWTIFSYYRGFFVVCIGNYSVYGFEINLSRSLGPFILSVYLPSAMFVMMSWVSFFIPPVSLTLIHPAILLYTTGKFNPNTLCSSKPAFSHVCYNELGLFFLYHR